tara:strand:+ start:827 stop:1465 length:639 start_codon:yes stop_codon:yes gene_type:complete
LKTAIFIGCARERFWIVLKSSAEYQQSSDKIIFIRGAANLLRSVFFYGRRRLMDRQPITREGHDKIKAEIKHLESVVIPEITERLAEARSEGDLKENTEYHGQREQQGMAQAKVNQLKTKLANCYIVDKADMPKGVVTFGSTVTVNDLKWNDEEEYEFVGPGEEDYDCEPMKILTSSPLAKAMEGKKVGDRVSVETPQGVRELEIVKIVDFE